MLTEISQEMIDLNHSSNLKSTAIDRVNGRPSVEKGDDLQMLDYPIGGVWESQKGLGNLGCVSVLKMLVGWR